jgi:hypothetical protein
MLIFQSQKFIKAAFNSEAELEQVVYENYELLFGPSSIFLPKSKIRTAGGFGTIPDGFAIDIATKRWYLVEAELIHHSLWNHIAPQITKQLLASQQIQAKRKIIDLSVEQYKSNPSTKEKFDEQNIAEIHVHRHIENILETDPIIGLPIDGVSDDLKEWARTLKYKVKLWLVNKYVSFDKQGSIVYELPEEFKPVLDTEEEVEDQANESINRYDVEINDLINAGILNVGDKLIMPYKPRNGQAKVYEAIINDDGTLNLLNQTFTSPSYAALYGIKDSGSTRESVNGWTAWKTKDGRIIAELREEYLNHRSHN